MVDKPEAVDHDLTLHGLDGIHHHTHCPGVQLLEALLGVDVLGQLANMQSLSKCNMLEVWAVPENQHPKPG